MDFPPNSGKAGAQAREPKVVERVTSGDAVRRKPSLGKQFKHTFLGGDAKTAMGYTVTSVMIPALQEMFLEAVQATMEKLVYGESRRGRRGPAPMSGPLGHVAYNRMGGMQPQRHIPGSPVGPQQPSRPSRARQSFDEIVIASRGEAEEVIDRMFDLLSKYDSATVADLYELTGLSSSHTDHKWGWTDLRGASVGRVRGGGYLLDLPEPEALG